MSGNKFYLYVFAFFIIVLSFLSCSDEDYEEISEYGKVTIDGLQKEFVIETTELKASVNNGNTASKLKASVNRGNAPYTVQGYDMRVENLDNSKAKIIQERFILNNNNNQGNGIVRDVVVGLNRFTATSFGGSHQTGWKNLGKLNGGDAQFRAIFYSSTLENSYPIYYKYKGEVVANISKNGDNRISFQMKPINGRIAIVVENNKNNYAFGVRINGNWKALYSNQCLCYLLNDDSPHGRKIDVQIDFYRRKGWGYQYKKRVNRSFNIEKGKNITRVIDLR